MDTPTNDTSTRHDPDPNQDASSTNEPAAIITKDKEDRRESQDTHMTFVNGDQSDFASSRADDFAAGVGGIGGEPNDVDGNELTASMDSQADDMMGYDETGSKDRPYLCLWEGCGKTFIRKSDLSRHLRIHRNLRAYQCDQCPKSFIQRSALTVHYRTHTKEKPYQCSYVGCTRAFSDSSSLARHRRTHAGIRPYMCPRVGCGKRFTRRSTLLKHYQGHPAGGEDIFDIKKNNDIPGASPLSVRAASGRSSPTRNDAISPIGGAIPYGSDPYNNGYNQMSNQQLYRSGEPVPIQPHPQPQNYQHQHQHQHPNVPPHQHQQQQFFAPQQLQQHSQHLQLHQHQHQLQSQHHPQHQMQQQHYNNMQQLPPPTMPPISTSAPGTVLIQQTISPQIQQSPAFTGPQSISTGSSYFNPQTSNFPPPRQQFQILGEQQHQHQQLIQQQQQHHPHQQQQQHGMQIFHPIVTTTRSDLQFMRSTTLPPNSNPVPAQRALPPPFPPSISHQHFSEQRQEHHQQLDQQHSFATNIPPMNPPALTSSILRPPVFPGFSSQGSQEVKEGEDPVPNGQKNVARSENDEGKSGLRE